MTLILSQLKSSMQQSIATAFKEIKDTIKETDDPDATIDSIALKLATNLSGDIDSYIKTATVTVLAGIPVATAGTAVAQTGATTSTGTGTLS